MCQKVHFDTQILTNLSPVGGETPSPRSFASIPRFGPLPPLKSPDYATVGASLQSGIFERLQIYIQQHLHSIHYVYY